MDASVEAIERRRQAALALRVSRQTDEVSKARAEQGEQEAQERGADEERDKRDDKREEQEREERGELRTGKEKDDVKVEKMTPGRPRLSNDEAAQPSALKNPAGRPPQARMVDAEKEKRKVGRPALSGARAARQSEGERVEIPRP